MKRIMRGIATIALLLSVQAYAQAQSSSANAPVKMVVGAPAGSSLDTVARLLADKIGTEVARTVIIENRAGAGGQIAANFVKSAPPDGLTLLLTNTHSMVMVPLTTSSVTYDPLRDFTAISRVSTFYEAITVPATASARTIPQWLSSATDNSSSANYGVPAAGSVAQFIGFRLGTEAKVSLVPVPYRGAGPAAQDLVGGQLAAAIVPIADVIAFQESGKVRILAVNGRKRATPLPDVPTLKELGAAGFDSLEWTAVVGPRNMPTSLVTLWNTALAKVLENADVRGRLIKLGMEAAASTPAELQADIAADHGNWGPVIRASGFKAD